MGFNEWSMGLDDWSMEFDEYRIAPNFHSFRELASNPKIKLAKCFFIIVVYVTLRCFFSKRNQDGSVLLFQNY